MTTLPIALLLTSFFTAFAIAFQFYIRRTIHHDVLEEQSRIIDPLLGVVGTLFSVLLGFLVAGAMDRYHDTCNTVDLEANSIADVFRVAKGLDKTDRVRIRNMARDYVTAVIDEEWKLMEKQQTSPKAWESYQDLWEATLSVQPEDDNRISNIQQSLLDAIKNLGENRRLRIVASQHGLTVVQWLVICVGAAITVLFTLFFPMKKAAFHVFLTVLVTVSLGLNIWLLSAYSTPFAGELKIEPYMFELLRGELLTKPDTPSIFLSAKDKEEDAEDPNAKKTNAKDADNDKQAGNNSAEAGDSGSAKTGAGKDQKSKAGKDDDDD